MAKAYTSRSGWEDCTVKSVRESRNLWDEAYDRTVSSGEVVYVPIYVGEGVFTCSTTCPQTTGGADYSNSRFMFFEAGRTTGWAQNAANGVSYGKPRTVTAEGGYVSIAYRWLQSNLDKIPWDYETMLNEGSTPLPYEPYGALWEDCTEYVRRNGVWVPNT